MRGKSVVQTFGKPSKKVYIAAALFSGRETTFNQVFATHLEDLGLSTILPQRDGYEFANLRSVLSQEFSKNEVPSLVETLIYMLDIGFFLPQSDFVIANLDEPLDEGVIVEICHARHAGIPVLGFRTDVRSPYGQQDDEFGGIHFFPAYECNIFIKFRMPSRNAAEAEAGWKSLIGKIEEAIGNLPEKAPIPPTGRFARTIKLAAELFRDIDDLHTPEALAEIAQRTRNHYADLTALRPTFLE